ncbi:MAG TPA: PKD domain-containing protein [Gemmatimonadaceae bacterium]
MPTRAPIRARARAAFTVLELVGSVVVIGILGVFVIPRVRDIREKAYIDAMLSDLRNYAVAQEAYRERYGTSEYAWPEYIEADGFHYTKNVYPDSSDAGPSYYFLRVRHEKTDVTCELDYSAGERPARNRPICYPAPFRNTPPAVDFDVYAVPEGAPAGDVAAPFAGRRGFQLLGSISSLFRTSSTFEAPEGADGPKLQFPVGRLLQFLPRAADEDGDALTYHWTFGSQDQANVAVATRRFLTSGHVPVTLTVTDARGVSRRRTKMLTVGLDGSATLVAQWDPCRSFGSLTLTDIAGQNDAALLWNGAPATGAKEAWQSGPPPFLDLSGGLRAYAQASSLASAPTTFAVLGAVRPTSSARMTLFDAGSFALQFTPGANVEVGGFAFPGAPPASQWSTLAVQVTAGGPLGGSVVEAFVDGRSLGAVPTSTRLALTGAPRLFCDAQGGNCLEGWAGPVLLYTGTLGSSDLAARTDQLGSDLAFCTAASTGRAPQAAFSWNPPVAVRGRPVQLDASASYDPDGDDIDYAWAGTPIGNGSPFTLPAIVRPSWVPPLGETSPSYALTLTVKDASGRWTRLTRQIPVNTAPVAEFMASTDTALVGQTVTFTATSTDGDGESLTHVWDLDGQSATGAVVSRSWAAPGIPLLRLTSTDPRGAADTAQHTIVVRSNAAPQAAFTVTPNPALVGESVTFASTSTDADADPLRFAWALGDGTENTAASLTHAYTASGTFTAQLVAADRWVADTAQHTVMVVAKPTVTASTGTLTPGQTDTVTFHVTNNSAMPRTFTFTASVVSGPATATNPSMRTIGAGQTAVVDVPVSAADSALADAAVQVRLVAADQGRSAAADSATTALTVEMLDRPPLVTGGPAFSLGPGKVAQQAYYVTNRSNTTRTLRIQVSAVYPVTQPTVGGVSDFTESFGPGEQKYYRFQYIVSAEAIAGTVGTATLTATNQTTGQSGSWSQNVTTKLEIANPSLTGWPTSATVYPGTTVQQPIRVHNNTNDVRTLTIAVSAPAGPVASTSVRDAVLTIQPRDSADNVVTYTIASGATNGATGTVTITIADQLSPSYTASGTLSLTVQNRAPSANVTCSPTSLDLRLGETTTNCTMTGSDPDGSALTASAGWTSTGAGRWSRSVTYWSTGTRQICGTVTDEGGATSTSTCASVTWLESSPPPPPNLPPTATVTCDQTKIKVGESTMCHLRGSDPDGPTLTSSWGAGVWDMAFSYSTTGTKTVSGTVTDPYGLSATASTTINVDPNTSPLSVSVSCPAKAEQGGRETYCTGMASGGTEPYQTNWLWRSPLGAWVDYIRGDVLGPEEHCFNVTDATGQAESACATVLIYASQPVSFDEYTTTSCTYWNGGPNVTQVSQQWKRTKTVYSDGSVSYTEWIKYGNPSYQSFPKDPGVSDYPISCTPPTP